MYHVTTDNLVTYSVYGNTPDELSYRGPSNSRLASGEIPRAMWHLVGGGESGWATPDPADPNIIHTGSQHVHRSTNAGRRWEAISPDLTLNDPSRTTSVAGQSPVAQMGGTPAATAAVLGPFDSRHFREIGPANVSGRIADFAICEPNPSIYYGSRQKTPYYPYLGCQ